MEIITSEIAGFKSAFKGLRNPMNSWYLSDSRICTNKGEVNDLNCNSCSYFKDINYCSFGGEEIDFIIGEKDMNLAKRMIKAGASDMKFLRQIHVWLDTDMPRYWWSEFDTYHFNTKNSCSTMHKLLNNKSPITLDMFVIAEEDTNMWENIVDYLEQLRLEYQREKGNDAISQRNLNRLLVRAKRLLPEGFLQLRTVDTNYMELRTMYHQRKHHRLTEEWVDTFCTWVETLPYAQELIIGEY